MAASVSKIGYGDTLEWSTDSGTTWTAVSELASCDVPSNSVQKVKRTHMGSPNRSHEYTSGLRDPSDVNFAFNFNSTDYAALYALEVAGTIAEWRHTLATNDGETTGAIYEYNGFVVLSGGTREVEGVTQVSGTINLESAATFTAGS